MSDSAVAYLRGVRMGLGSAWRISGCFGLMFKHEEVKAILMVHMGAFKTAGANGMYTQFGTSARSESTISDGGYVASTSGVEKRDL